MACDGFSMSEGRNKADVPYVLLFLGYFANAPLNAIHGYAHASIPTT